MSSKLRPDIVFLDKDTIKHSKIQSRKDLNFYLKADQLSCGIKNISIKHYIMYPTLIFQALLRHAEFYKNCSNNIFNRVLFKGYWLLLQHYRIKLSLTIPLNVFGPGLSVAHYGTIIVHKLASIGNNCRIHPGVCIGGLQGKAPSIGNNVYIGPGVKIFGGISIGNNVAIGANSVVTKNIPSNCTIIGVPAKIVSHKGSKKLCLRGTELVGKKNIDWTEFNAEVLA